MGELDDSMPAAQSIFSLTEGGSLPHQKRRKGGNPTSTGQTPHSPFPHPPGPLPRTPSCSPSPLLPA